MRLSLEETGDLTLLLHIVTKVDNTPHLHLIIINIQQQWKYNNNEKKRRRKEDGDDGGKNIITKREDE